jgi:flagellar M-ring protein FliF
MAQRSEPLLRCGTILAAMLAFLFFVARPALRSLTSGQGRRTAAAPAASPAVPLRVQAAAEVPELSPEQQMAEERKIRAQNVFEQVAQNVKRDPMQSTRLLESWIRSE